MKMLLLYIVNQIKRMTGRKPIIRNILSIKGLVILFAACIMPCIAQSQATIKGILQPPKDAYSQSILELLMNLNEINPGTIVAPTLKTAVARDYEHSEIDTTAKRENKIKIYPKDDYFKLELDIKDNNQRVQIITFNMLGKKVDCDVQEVTQNKEYNIIPSRLPNGIYLCLVQGDNFQLREKFVVSR